MSEPSHLCQSNQSNFEVFVQSLLRLHKLLLLTHFSFQFFKLFVPAALSSLPAPSVLTLCACCAQMPPQRRLIRFPQTFSKLATPKPPTPHPTPLPNDICTRVQRHGGGAVSEDTGFNIWCHLPFVFKCAP